MLNKIRSSLNIIIIFLFLISIVYFIIFSVFQMFSKNGGQKLIKINKENVEIYSDSKYSVSDYSEFYTIEGIIQTIITALHDEKYLDLYNICDNDMKDKLGKEEYNKKLNEYYMQNYKYSIDDGMAINGYQNKDNLVGLYKIEENSYICDVKTLNKTSKISIKLFEKQKYKITYLSI